MKDFGVDDRSVAYWMGKGFPREVATHQAAWERRRAIWWMHKQGMTHTQIGEALDRTRSRIHQIIWEYERWKKNGTSPVMQHLTRWGELHDLTTSKHTMQMIGWLAGGPKPTVKLRHRVRVEQRKDPPFNPTDADMAAIWDVFAKDCPL